MSWQEDGGVSLKGMDSFLSDLQDYARKASDENLQKVLMAGGEALAADVRKLPKPRRARSGDTHMLDMVKAESKPPKRVYVGWSGGGYYGGFVEFGTTKMRAQPHLWPTWNQNKLKYYTLMKQLLWR